MKSDTIKVFRLNMLKFMSDMQQSFGNVANELFFNQVESLRKILYYKLLLVQKMLKIKDDDLEPLNYCCAPENSQKLSIKPSDLVWDGPKSEMRVNDSFEETPDNDSSVEIMPIVFSPQARSPRNIRDKVNPEKKENSEKKISFSLGAALKAAKVSTKHTLIYYRMQRKRKKRKTQRWTMENRAQISQRAKTSKPFLQNPNLFQC